MNQKLKEGREWATKRLREYAQKADVPIDNTSWHDIVSKDASEFAVESGGEKKLYEIQNLLLEDDQCRNDVDQIMESIVKEFS